MQRCCGYPYSADFKSCTVSAALDAGSALQGQLVVATFNRDGSLAPATPMQTAREVILFCVPLYCLYF
ncbi:hypothetical protein [Reinekea sp.]|uniref:hypothetical protein n=1 Tax=Reinekea sp. TaxID=1970455 RepID=UPI0039C3E147